MDSLLGKTLAELQEVAQRVGLPKFAGKQLAEWLYVRRAMTFDEMTNISLKGREALKQHYTTGRHAPVAEAVSQDGTRKYLFQIVDAGELPLPVPTCRDGEGDRGRGKNGGAVSRPHPIDDDCAALEGGGINAQLSTLNSQPTYIESVYIPDADRATLCVSTQAGCKMGCKFCMTGTLGFHGHLPAAEILNQILYFGDLTNVVYMGEGEPMDNLDNVLRSLQVLTADWGCAWSPKRITVSSVGHPNLKRFLDESECHLAISLHNPFAAERREIMPAEKMYSLAQVVALLKQYDWTHQRRISFEYICWHGQNDTIRHANELLRLLRSLPCRINLIRFHSSPALSREGFTGSDEKQMEWLRDYLTSHGITTTIRRSRGEDILAACGMLVNALTSTKSN
ncbi:MAG: 23S rRNA (adenine(2503)-C(2))-methyltransferase RlmN [Paludibacteraceae bacterium]